MSDVTFKVDEKNRVIICKIFGCCDIAKGRIWKYAKYGFLSKYTIPDVFVGVARCCPEDEFDVEYGKKLALTRAKVKRGKAINNTIYKFTKDMDRLLSNLEQYGIHKIPDEEDI